MHCIKNTFNLDGGCLIPYKGLKNSDESLKSSLCVTGSNECCCRRVNATLNKEIPTELAERQKEHAVRFCSVAEGWYEIGFDSLIIWMVSEA